MSGSKKKSNESKAPALPAALPGPVLNVPPTPQPMSGQLELIAQQLGQGYPSMPQADMLKQLQAIYKPPTASATPALPTTSTSGRGVSGQGLGGGGVYKGNVPFFNDFNDFGNFIANVRK